MCGLGSRVQRVHLWRFPAMASFRVGLAFRVVGFCICHKVRHNEVLSISVNLTFTFLKAQLYDVLVLASEHWC